MKISIHQPDYVPYIGYFYKMWQSDVFVFLDDVQFSNDNMHNWNRVKTPQGECRLKIPVDYKFGNSINLVRPRDELKWKEKHLKTIEANYARAKYFKEYYPKFKDVVLGCYPNLAEMNIAINSYIATCFGIKPKVCRTSMMNISSVREERVIDICSMLGGKTYISGNGARAYQVEDHFVQRGLRLQYTEYRAVKYSQLWGDFLPNMSIIDYIFNCGYEWDIIIKALDYQSEIKG